MLKVAIENMVILKIRAVNYTVIEPILRFTSCGHISCGYFSTLITKIDNVKIQSQISHQ